MLPPLRRWPLLLPALVPLLLAALGCTLNSAPDLSGRTGAGPGQSYLFCFWNTQDLFDDKLNGWKTEPDKTCDAWFAGDDKARNQKYDNLSRVLTGLNAGKGPDILAVAELESERSAELLAEALNKRLRDPALHYKNIAFRDPRGGRRITTAVITRLPLLGNRTHLHGNRVRILEAVISVNGKELVVLATHWTSRVSDERGDGRAKYADQIYGTYKAMYKANPKVDVLICGDFNDNPDDPSVTEHLHAVSDEAKVLRAGGDEPLLLNVFGKSWAGDKTEGTHNHRGHWYLFDQIVVSPGMLDREGWHCDVKSAAIVRRGDLLDRKGRPLSFGSEKDKTPLGDRGCSDHLPVTVRLELLGGK